MKKKITLTFLLLMTWMLACQKDANTEIKGLLTKMTKLGNQFAEELTAAKNVQEIVKIMKKYGEEIEPSVTAMKEMPQKYPQLKGQKQVPEVLKDDFAKYSESMKKQSLLMAELLAKYQENAEFLAARKELMGKLAK